MKIITILLTAIVSQAVFAEPVAAKIDLDKFLAQKYLDIALVTSHARVNQRCESGTHINEITSATIKAIEHARYSQDSAFAKSVLSAITASKALQATVQTQLSYRHVLVRPTLDYGIEATRAALIGSVMYGPEMGALGNVSEITFGNASSAKIVTKEYDPNDDTRIILKNKYVSYSVSLNAEYQKIVTIDQVRYRLVETQHEYLLVPEGSTDDTDAYRNGFAEIASECEAS